MPSWIKRLLSPSWATLLVLVGVLVFVLGSKCGLIQRFGSDLPFMDQWDAEAQMLLIPSAEGKLGVDNFIAPHNEHRIILTKLLNFSLTQLNGQWSPLLEMTLGALIHICTIATLLAFARRHMSAPAFAFVALFAALLFALSYAWENTLQGFQSQFYLLMWSAVTGIWLMAGATAPGKRWWWGLVVLGLGLGSMSSGFVAAVAIGAVLLLRRLVEWRWEKRDGVALTCLFLISLCGLLLMHRVPGHDILKAANSGEFLSSLFSCLAWPQSQAPAWAVVVQLPALLLVFFSLRQRRLSSADAVILGLSLWCWLQLAALSDARGHMSPTLSPRYSDLMALGVLVNAIALGRILYGRTERLRPWLAIVWALAVVPALLDLGAASTAYLSTSFLEKRIEEVRLLREFQRTQDEAVLRKAPVESLPHPSADTIIRVLRHPGLQPLLPSALQADLAPAKGAYLARANLGLLRNAAVLKYAGLALILLGLFGIGLEKRGDFAGLLRPIMQTLSAFASRLRERLARLGASLHQLLSKLDRQLPQGDMQSPPAEEVASIKRRRLVTVLACAAVILLTLGAKFGLIHHYGSDLPFMDTWDAQADRILIPHAEGRLTAPDFWAPHNEHHVLWTRLLNFGLTLANRQWDPKLECAANALLITALAASLLLFTRRQLRGLPFLLVAAVLCLLYALPIGYENTLYGFQSQFYFLALAAFGSLWLCLGAKPFGLRWCAGALLALSGIASMASGFLAPAALLAVAALRTLLERRLTLRDALGAAVVGLILCVGVLWIHPMPLHAELHAQSPGQFLGTMLAETSWPWPASLPVALLMQVPVLLLLTRVCRERRLDAWDAVVIGLSTWSWLQLAAVAYARGAVSIQECPRYEDLFVLGVVANALALGRLLSGGSRRGWSVILTAAWVSCLIIGTAPQWEKLSRGILPETVAQRANSARQLRPYLRTHDNAAYARIADQDLPYPDRVRLKRFLDHTGLQPLWPVSLRPAAILQAAPESKGFARTTAPLAQFQPDEPVWSASEGPALFVSAPLSENLLPVLQFRFVGDKDLEAGVIAILSADGVRHPLSAAPLAGHRWQTANLPIPDAPRPLRIVVDLPAGSHRFAFADPIEMGRLSWYAKYVLSSHAWLTWLGLALGAAAVALAFPLRRMD